MLDELDKNELKQVYKKVATCFFGRFIANILLSIFQYLLLLVSLKKLKYKRAKILIIQYLINTSDVLRLILFHQFKLGIKNTNSGTSYVANLATFDDQKKGIDMVKFCPQPLVVTSSKFHKPSHKTKSSFMEVSSTC